jgi:Mg-chelatase subunit ChlD
MALRKRYSLVLLFFAVFALNFLGGGLQAAPERAGFSQENIAVILLIDTSGSMRTTDPQRLRETAARIFIDLLSPEDYLGLITFDHEANVVLPLQKVSSSANKELFKEGLSPQLEPRGNTDFTKALKAAAEQFRKTDAGGARPVAVLLTDGEPDPEPRRRGEALFMENYMQSLWETVGAFALEGYPIYTVGFGDGIDPEVIRKVSLDTKGEFYLLNEPAELLVSFFELLGNLKNRRSFIEEVYTLEAEGAVQFDFLVDEYTRQVNFVAVSPSAGQCAISLTPPQGGSSGITGLTVNNEDNYSMAILHQPEKAYWGKWQGHVSGRGAGNRHYLQTGQQSQAFDQIHSRDYCSRQAVFGRETIQPRLLALSPQPDGICRPQALGQTLPVYGMAGQKGAAPLHKLPQYAAFISPGQIVHNFPPQNIVGRRQFKTGGASPPNQQMPVAHPGMKTKGLIAEDLFHRGQKHSGLRGADLAGTIIQHAFLLIRPLPRKRHQVAAKSQVALAQLHTHGRRFQR